MAFFKIRLDGTEYEIDKLTIGDARVLKRDFGLDDLSSFSPTDPDQMAGLIFLALRKARPDEDPAVLLAEVDALDLEELSEVDPSPAEKVSRPKRPAAAKAGS